MNAASAGVSAVSSLITSDPRRRGACPTLEKPMQTGDGLLARIRVARATISPAQLLRLAELASEHGNGMVEVTARGNLQVRGLTSESTPLFARAVQTVVAVESGVVIGHSPIAGIDPDEIADPPPLVEAIRSGSASVADRLGPKVSVVVDGAGQVPLSSLKADISLVAVDATQWAVTLGGAKPQLMDASGAVAATIAVLGALAAIGPDARASDLFPTHQNRPPRPVAISAITTTTLRLTSGHTTGVTLPFGATPAHDLADLARAAATAGIETIRLAPGHRLLFDNAPDDFLAKARTLGFVTAAEDPRHRISACIGNQGCASGRILSRALAAELAAQLGPVGHLHVSGCSKGCAHPRPATVTLVGTPTGIGLVINGRAGDTPQTLLDPAHLGDALVRVQSGQ